MTQEDYIAQVLKHLRHVTGGEYTAIRAELSGHLEDRIEALMECGLDETAADCSETGDIHLNWLDWDGSVVFFGRVDSTAVSRVEVLLQRELEQLTFTIDDFIEKDGQRYILSFMDWDFGAVLPEAYTITAAAYGIGGETLDRQDISRAA